MSKRGYFLISSLVLTSVFFLLSLISFQWKYTGIAGFSLGVAIFQIVLFYSMAKSKPNLLVSAFLPMMFSLGISLFRFLFAVNWVWEIVLVVVFLFGIYTLFLIENVFLVSAEIKTVPLIRAANIVGFLITLITSFFIYQVVFSFRLPSWQNGGLILAANIPILIHYFWSIRLKRPFTWKNLRLALIFSVILGEIAIAVSYWPLEVTKASLYLTSIAYVFLGLSHAYCQEKLFKETIREFVLVGLGTFIALFLVTNWR